MISFENFSKKKEQNEYGVAGVFKKYQEILILG